MMCEAKVGSAGEARRLNVRSSARANGRRWPRPCQNAFLRT